MTITLCASLDFFDATLRVKESLEAHGASVEWPRTMEMLVNGSLAHANLEAWKRSSKSEAMRIHCAKIARSDAILVVNIEKHGVPNYIGGNVFLEIGYAYVLKKPIYLLHPIPDVSYRDEIEAMTPIVLDGDLSRIPTMMTAPTYAR